MDWSLVLISQGIGSEIQEDQVTSTWGLLVLPEDYPKAISAIRQYRIENRRWWRQEVFHPGLLFDWGSLAWVALLILFYWMDAQAGLRSAGMMDNTAVFSGQWWRLFTAIWLHGDLGHLAANASVGLLLLGLTMGRIGTGPGLLMAYLAGAGGNAIAMMFSPPSAVSLGASGMVMGCLGILTAQSLLQLRTSGFRVKTMISGIAAGLMLFVLLGLSPDSYVQAHLGGFVSGLILGIFSLFSAKLSRKTVVNVVCGFVFTLLVLLPWWFGLSK
jgi:membrane associated rhomboid family serine protease